MVKSKKKSPAHTAKASVDHTSPASLKGTEQVPLPLPKFQDEAPITSNGHIEVPPTSPDLSKPLGRSRSTSRRVSFATHDEMIAESNDAPPASVGWPEVDRLASTHPNGIKPEDEEAIADSPIEEAQASFSPTPLSGTITPEEEEPPASMGFPAVDSLASSPTQPDFPSFTQKQSPDPAFLATGHSAFNPTPSGSGSNANENSRQTALLSRQAIRENILSDFPELSEHADGSDMSQVGQRVNFQHAADVCV
jgi:hypothetical protein